MEKCGEYGESIRNKGEIGRCICADPLRNVAFRASPLYPFHVPSTFVVSPIRSSTQLTLLAQKSICNYAAQFGGSDQHDSQEFLTFLLDALHEDLNRVLTKPNNEPLPEREAELEKLPQQIASEQEWEIYRMRNDSLIVDYFQGQFRNRMECLTCHHVSNDSILEPLRRADKRHTLQTSTTYNSFMYLSLPIPSIKGPSKASLYSCLDAFVKEEVLEKSEAW